MISPGRRPSGTPAITTSPMPAMTSPRMTRLRPTARPLSAREFEAAEEVAELEGGRLGRVGAVRRVALDRLAELLAQAAGLGLGGVGGAHQRPPPGNRVRRL